MCRCRIFFLCIYGKSNENIGSLYRDFCEPIRMSGINQHSIDIYICVYAECDEKKRFLISRFRSCLLFFPFCFSGVVSMSTSVTRTCHDGLFLPGIHYHFFSYILRNQELIWFQLSRMFASPPQKKLMIKRYFCNVPEKVRQCSNPADCLSIYIFLTFLLSRLFAMLK